MQSSFVLKQKKEKFKSHFIFLECLIIPFSQIRFQPLRSGIAPMPKRKSDNTFVQKMKKAEKPQKSILASEISTIQKI